MPSNVTKAQTYRERMHKLAREVDNAGNGHDPAGSKRTLAQIWEWTERSIALIKIVSDIPYPAYSILKEDAGYLTARSVINGETVFYLCEDCRFPMIKEDKKEGCLVCGDNFSKAHRVVIGEANK